MTTPLKKLENLALIARQLSTCLAAGMTTTQAVKTLCGRSHSVSFRADFKQVGQRIEQGYSFGEAFSIMETHLPPFARPFIEVAESGGRIPEGFDHLEHLCDRLIPVFKAARQLWLVPLSILLFGFTVRLAIMISFGEMDMALHNFVQMVLSVFGLVLAIQILKQTQTGQKILDQLLTRSPFLGQASQAIALSLFLQSLNFLYRAGGKEFTTMIQEATASVPSRRIRLDLGLIENGVKQGLTLPEALRAPHCFNEKIKNTLSNGALVGRLEQSLDQVTDYSTEELEGQLRFTRVVLARLMGFALMGSIYATIAMLM